MTKFTIKNGKLYRTGTKKVGLAEYLDWALKLPYLPVDEGRAKSGNAHILSVSRETGGRFDLDINLSNYYGSISDMEFEIEAEELVDLKTDEIPIMSFSEFNTGYTTTFYDVKRLPDTVISGKSYNRRLIYYIDIESGETLLVWDDENGYAWEVE